MKKFDPTLNTVFTDDGKPVIAPMGQPSGAIIESIGENLNRYDPWRRNCYLL